MQKNYWVEKLRNAKNWDFAVLTLKSSAPIQLPRETNYIVEEDPKWEDKFYLSISAETPISVPPQPGKAREDAIITNTTIDLEEIVRIDFVHKVQLVGTEGAKKPGIIMP